MISIEFITKVIPAIKIDVDDTFLANTKPFTIGFKASVPKQFRFHLQVRVLGIVATEYMHVLCVSVLCA